MTSLRDSEERVPAGRPEPSLLAASERDADSVDVRYYLGVLRSRKWSVVSITVALVVIVVGLSLLQTPIYTATAKVLVQPLPSGPSSTTLIPVDVGTESQIVASQPVAKKVRSSTASGMSLKELLSGLDVQGATPATGTVTSGAQLLQVDYSSPSPSRAANMADAFAKAYIDYRTQQTLGATQQAKRSVQQQLSSASGQLDQLDKRLDAARAAGDSGLVSTLESQRNILIARMGVLQQRLDDLQPTPAQRTGGAQLIQPAQVPTSPSSPDYVRNALLALVVGLVLGIGFAFLRQRLDDRFYDHTTLEASLGAPVLALVPRFEKTGRWRALALELPHSPAGEAYRSLRTNLLYLAQQRGYKIVVVTSPGIGEGKTTTVVNLGVVMAQAGLRVILVSADLRRPKLEAYLSPGTGPGLSGVLKGDAELSKAIVAPGIMNLRLLPCGSVPSNPAELLTSPRLAEILRVLAANADVVLVDSPPATSVADAGILAAHADATLLVVDADTTRRSAALHAQRSIDRAGGRVIGAVMNGFDPSASPYYYAGSYGYGYGSGATQRKSGRLEGLLRGRVPLSRSRVRQGRAGP